jgi:hypothetical protein
MRPNRLAVSVFVGSAVFAFAVAAFGGVVSARWQRISPSFCIVGHQDAFPTSWTHYITGLENTSNNNAGITADCPIVETDVFPKTAVRTLKVHVVDRHGTQNVGATACRQDYSGTGGACGAYTYSSGASTTAQILWPALTNWTSTGMAYVSVSIPATYIWTSGNVTNYDRSRLVGLYTEDI